MAETTLLTRRSKRIALRVSLAGAKPSWYVLDLTASVRACSLG